MTKVKEFFVGVGGVYRILFDLKAATIQLATGRIYVNGVAVGTSQMQANSWETFSEDIGIAAHDLVQLYVQRHSSGTTYYVRNFKLKGDLGSSIGVENSV